MVELDPRSELERMRDAARRTTRGRFEEQHGGWYLVCRATAAPAGSVGRPAFETESLDLQDIPDLLRRAIESGETPAVATAFGPGMGELHAIRKVDAEAWASRVTVGRATNNDVVLRYKTVSKIHGHFRLLEEGEDGVPALKLMDLGSRNGTRVNERRLDVDRWLPLTDGDRLRFGSLETQLVSAGLLYSRLRDWH